MTATNIEPTTAAEEAHVNLMTAQTIHELVDAGFTPLSAADAVKSGDLSVLVQRTPFPD